MQCCCLFHSLQSYSKRGVPLSFSHDHLAPVLNATSAACGSAKILISQCRMAYEIRTMNKYLAPDAILYLCDTVKMQKAFKCTVLTK